MDNPAGAAYSQKEKADTRFARSCPAPVWSLRTEAMMTEPFSPNSGGPADDMHGAWNLGGDPEPDEPDDDAPGRPPGPVRRIDPASSALLRGFDRRSIFSPTGSDPGN